MREEGKPTDRAGAEPGGKALLLFRGGLDATG
jgi:hypothetical protein